MLPKLSFKNKLIFLVSIAILSFIAGVLPFAQITYRNYIKSKQSLETAEIADILIDTIDKLEKERGLSTIYVLSKNDYFKNQMYREQNILDMNLTKLQDTIINSSFNTGTKEKLSEKIKNIESNLFNAREAILLENGYIKTFYIFDKNVEELLSLFKEISPFNDFIKEIIYSIDTVKNIECKLRTIIGTAIIKKNIDFGTEKLINNLLIEKKSIIKYNLPKELIDKTKKIKRSEEEKFFYETLSSVLNKKTPDINIINWWKSTSKYIELIKKAENKLLNEEIKKAEEVEIRAKRNLIIFIGLFLFTLSIMSFMFWAILKDIYENINNLKAVLSHASKGEFNIKMDENNPGEMGEIAKNVNRILQSFQKFVNNEKIFIASVSHELRTPLNGIIGFLNLLKTTPLTEEQKNYTENSQIAAHQLLELIEDLLDTTKIQTGQIEIREEPFDINRIIKDIVKTLHVRLQKDIEIKINLPDFKNYLIGNPKRVRQIFYNLISNAIKYTEKGKIEIGIKNRKEEDDTIKLEFYIKDTGIGIPKEKRNKIFEPFSRVHTDIKGTGLGLYISKNLAKLMGGDIYLESDEGKGTTFYVKLKFKKGEEKTEKRKETENLKKSDFSDISVLIAEDELLNRKLLTKILEKSFNIKNIKTVENGEEAYRESVINRDKYDLILLDLQMPVMDGLTALEKIRKAGVKTPIYILTADAYRESEEKAEKLASGYLTKPLDLKKLRETLENIEKGNGHET